MHYWREIPQKHDRFALFGSPQLGIWKTHFWGVRFFGHFKAQQPKKKLPTASTNGHDRRDKPTEQELILWGFHPDWTIKNMGYIYI